PRSSRGYAVVSITVVRSRNLRSIEESHFLVARHVAACVRMVTANRRRNHGGDGGERDSEPKCPSEDFLSPLNHLDSMEPILIRGRASIVDGQEPGEVRPRSLEISERPD